MKCVVTGGCGFIGSHLVDALVARNDDVVVVDDLSTGDIGNLNKDATFVNKSILDSEPLDMVIKNADCVFHLAAWARVARSVADPRGTHDVNVGGTLSVLESIRRNEIPRLVYISSSSVYGDQDTHIMKEDMKPYPKSPYGLQKLIGEQYCTVYAQLFDLKIASLRYFNVYGPRQAAEGPYTMVIGRFQQQRDAGDSLTVYGDGKQTRAYTYIRDVVEATILAGTKTLPQGKNEIINIGTDEDTSVIEIAQLIDGDIEHVYPNPRGLFEEKRKSADYSKAKSLLGWEPTVSFRDGFEITYSSTN